MSSSKFNLAGLLVVVIILAVAIVYGLLFFGLHQSVFLSNLGKTDTGKVIETNNDKSDEQKKANETLIAEVGTHILLPKEEPEIATITDVDKLRETEVFFNLAQNDDKLLVFKKAKKLILYRPSEKKIVDLAPLAGDQLPASDQSPLLPNQP